MAEGFEEIEAVAVIDILRRGGVELKTFSISGNKNVKGAHEITILCDALFEDIDFNDGEIILLPGGMPGTTNLSKHEGLQKVLLNYQTTDKWIGAICAAPTVLGKLGIIDGKTATCYPGCEKDLGSANYVKESVVVDGKIVTSRGVGTALEFGLKLIELTIGYGAAQKLKSEMLI